MSSYVDPLELDTEEVEQVLKDLPHTDGCAEERTGVGGSLGKLPLLLRANDPKVTPAIGRLPLDAAPLERAGRVPGEYLILERSADLRERQAATLTERVPHLAGRVRWLDQLPPAGLRGAVIANELLDAMPAARFRIGDAGIEVIIDDRNERPGVKFNDGELVGIPYRVTVGPRGLGEGIVEVHQRATGETENVAVAHAIDHVVRRVLAERT